MARSPIRTGALDAHCPNLVARLHREAPTTVVRQ